MYIDFTEQEYKQAEAIEKKYNAEFDIVNKIKYGRIDEPPELLQPIQYPEEATIEDIEQIKKENNLINANNIKVYEKWEATGSVEWREARKQWDIINANLNNARTEFFKKSELRHFKELGNDPANILENAKKQVKMAIKEQIKEYSDMNLNGSFSSIRVCALGNGKWLLDEEELRAAISGTLHLHIETLKKHTALLLDLNNFIDKTLKADKHVAPPGQPGKGQMVKARYPIEYQRKKKGEIIRTKYPTQFIAPTDKVSRFTFDGKLTEIPIPLAMENKRSKKEITSYVSINFDDLNGSIQIKGRKELTPYDREVHDAIITLFVDGENEYITPQMIYRVITGDPLARLEKKQAEAISNSITKCMYSKITIDAKEEAAAYKFDNYKYDGSLISGERITATLNGTVSECIHILRQPILYEYASNKNQISRTDINLLNTPINKTEELITLQSYLYRRILSMKGSSSLSKTIVYDTAFSQIDLKASSDGALRKKKSKVRGQMKIMFDFWKEQSFILGYCENKRGQSFYSVAIRV